MDEIGAYKVTQWVAETDIVDLPAYQLSLRALISYELIRSNVATTRARANWAITQQYLSELRV